MLCPCLVLCFTLGLWYMNYSLLFHSLFTYEVWGRDKSFHSVKTYVLKVRKIRDLCPVNVRVCGNKLTHWNISKDQACVSFCFFRKTTFSRTGGWAGCGNGGNPQEPHGSRSDVPCAVSFWLKMCPLHQFLSCSSNDISQQKLFCGQSRAMK